MNSDIIVKWNSIINKDDDVYFLGDFSLTGKGLRDEILNSLNGKIYFIRGNHDDIKNAHERFEWVKDYHELKMFDKETGVKQKIIMSHYPFETWNNKHRGSWHLHGHCHGNLPSNDSTARLDVGWDCFGRPVSYEEIKFLMTRKVFKVETIA